MSLNAVHNFLRGRRLGRGTKRRERAQAGTESVSTLRPSVGVSERKRGRNRSRPQASGRGIGLDPETLSQSKVLTNVHHIVGGSGGTHIVHYVHAKHGAGRCVREDGLGRRGREHDDGRHCVVGRCVAGREWEVGRCIRNNVSLGR